MPNETKGGYQHGKVRLSCKGKHRPGSSEMEKVRSSDNSRKVVMLDPYSAGSGTDGTGKEGGMEGIAKIFEETLWRRWMCLPCTLGTDRLGGAYPVL